MGPDNRVGRCIAHLGEKPGNHALIWSTVRSSTGAGRAIAIQNITTHGASILGARRYKNGARIELLLRNVGWAPAYVCLADDNGCEVIFEHYVNPNLPIAA